MPTFSQSALLSCGALLARAGRTPSLCDTNRLRSLQSGITSAPARLRPTLTAVATLPIGHTASPRSTPALRAVATLPVSGPCPRRQAWPSRPSPALTARPRSPPSSPRLDTSDGGRESAPRPLELLPCRPAHQTSSHARPGQTRQFVSARCRDTDNSSSGAVRTRAPAVRMQRGNDGGCAVARCERRLAVYSNPSKKIAAPRNRPAKFAAAPD